MRWLIASVLLALLAAVLVATELQRRWELPLAVPAGGFPLTIEQGDSLRSVVRDLHTAGVVPYPLLLIAYGRWSGLDAEIKRGEYQLPRELTGKTLLLFLQRGRVIEYQVTLPEGITLAAALEILAGAEALETVLEGVNDERLLSLASPHASPEGLFFPDSYRYVRGDTDWSILQRAYTQMHQTLQEAWARRAQDSAVTTPYEALIMASIIERETGLPSERGDISGVFARRMRRGMLLQTDPTVIYGLGREFDGNLRRVHLTDGGNPYNTYVIRGLPPTPIALPGRESILAALNPEPGNALYFVARGDGGHVFSDTLSQHNRAVRDYQLRRRRDYRSSPEVSQ